MGAVRSGWDDRTPRGKQREQPRRPNLARMGNCDRRLVARPRPLSFLAGASAYRTQASARRNAPMRLGMAPSLSPLGAHTSTSTPFVQRTQWPQWICASIFPSGSATAQSVEL